MAVYFLRTSHVSRGKGVRATDMAWTQDRASLWNAAEGAGKRRNSRLARECLVLLPPELDSGRRARLAHRFAAEIAERYRCAVDLTVHRPRPGADPRNHHAHLLMTRRQIGPRGLGVLTAPEASNPDKGPWASRAEYLRLRERPRPDRDYDPGS